MSKELEAKYVFNDCGRQFNQDLINLMKCLRLQDEDNKAILYAGRHIKKIILPFEEYQKMCQRLENIDNANPNEALECLEEIEKTLMFTDEETLETKTLKEVMPNYYNTINKALLNKSKKEKAFEEIQSIIDTWHTSHIMDNESALREIDKIICEVLDNDKRISN